MQILPSRWDYAAESAKFGKDTDLKAGLTKAWHVTKEQQGVRLQTSVCLDTEPTEAPLKQSAVPLRVLSPFPLCTYAGGPLTASNQ